MGDCVRACVWRRVGEGGGVCVEGGRLGGGGGRAYKSISPARAPSQDPPAKPTLMIQA